MTLNSIETQNINSIKICYWNVHGRKSQIFGDKLLDPEFLQNLENSDIVSLTELHTEEKDIFLPGYRLLKTKLRNKQHKSSKVGGGMAVFIRENLYDLTHVVPNTNENSIWIKLKKMSSKDKDIFIGTFYISPETKKSKTNLLDMLNEEINLFSKKGEIILQGDFNARTGQKKDFIQHDPFFEDLFGINEGNKTKAPPPRNSEDHGTNNRGDELLDFCKSNEFSIVNGRKIGDLFGKCTSHQYNGSSAIDYLLTTNTFFENISMFQVGNFVPWLSDHSPIYADIKLNLERKPPEAPINLKKREAGFVWNDGCEENFKELLAKQNIKIEHPNLEAVRNSDANKLADEIKKSLIEASKGCNLKKRKHRKTENTKPWFDNECKEIKKNVTEIGKKTSRKSWKQGTSNGAIQFKTHSKENS